MIDLKKINNISKRSNGKQQANTTVLCILSIADFFNKYITEKEIEKSIHFDRQGKCTLEEVASIFESLGLQTEAFQAEAVQNMDVLTNPAIIPIFDENNVIEFAIYWGKYENKYLIGYAGWGLNLYQDFEFDSIWDDKILLEVKEAKINE